MVATEKRSKVYRDLKLDSRNAFSSSQQQRRLNKNSAHLPQI